MRPLAGQIADLSTVLGVRTVVSEQIQFAGPINEYPNTVG